MLYREKKTFSIETFGYIILRIGQHLTRPICGTKSETGVELDLLNVLERTMSGSGTPQAKLNRCDRDRSKKRHRMITSTVQISSFEPNSVNGRGREGLSI